MNLVAGDEKALWHDPGRRSVDEVEVLEMPGKIYDLLLQCTMRGASMADYYVQCNHRLKELKVDQAEAWCNLKLGPSSGMSPSCVRNPFEYHTGLVQVVQQG